MMILHYIYSKCTKLLGKDESLDIEFIKLKSKFYKYLKTNIKTIIEYDFS